MLKVRNPSRVCSMLGFATLAMMAVWYAGTWVITPLLLSHWPAFFKFEWALWLLNDVPLYFLGLPAFLLIWRFIPEAPPVERERKKLSFGHYVLIFLFCLGAMYAISFVSNIIITAIDSFKPSGGGDDAISNLANNSGILGNILFGAVVPALGEEFVFRYMFHRKLRGAGDKIYMVVSALCFAMFHANFGQIGYAFVLGIVLAWLYARTKNIWLPVSLHFLCNLFGMVIIPNLFSIESLFWPIFILVYPVLGVTAIVLLCVHWRRFVATFHAPTEQGWPYKQPKTAYYYIDPVTRRPVPVPSGAMAGFSPYMAPGQPAYGYNQYNMPPATPGYPAYGQQSYYPQAGLVPGYGYGNYPPQGAPAPYGAPQYPAYPTSGYGTQQPYPPYGGSPYGTAPNTYNNVPVPQPWAQPAGNMQPVTQAPGTVAFADTSPAIAVNANPSAVQSEASVLAVASPPASQTGPTVSVPAAASTADAVAMVIEKAAPAESRPSAASISAPTAPAAYPTVSSPAQQPMPYGAPQPYAPYGAAPMPTFVGKVRSAFGVCIANAGMLCYFIITLFLTLANLFG